MRPTGIEVIPARLTELGIGVNAGGMIEIEKIVRIGDLPKAGMTVTIASGVLLR